MQFTDTICGGVWRGNVDASGNPIGYGVMDFTNSPKANAKSVTGYFGRGIRSGQGWVKYQFQNGEVYEGFMVDNKFCGYGCLWMPNTEKASESRALFFKGTWRNNMLVDGTMHEHNGRVPLQYQCKKYKPQTVREVAQHLVQLMRKWKIEISLTFLIDELIRLNSKPNRALTSSSRLRFFTILRLPECLRLLASPPCLARRTASPEVCAVGAAPGRAFHFLVGKIVEVPKSAKPYHKIRLPWSKMVSPYRHPL
jgi:hypothetical protein